MPTTGGRREPRLAARRRVSLIGASAAPCSNQPPLRTSGGHIVPGL
jgi:hypothetical protein